MCISDTHTTVFEVPDGDVLLHSGDLTGTGTVGQMQETMEWVEGIRRRGLSVRCICVLCSWCWGV